jgi:hypothetical protein
MSVAELLAAAGRDIGDPVRITTGTAGPKFGRTGTVIGAVKRRDGVWVRVQMDGHDDCCMHIPAWGLEPVSAHPERDA